MAKRRPKVPKKIETEVLVRCKRRCPLCFGIDGNVQEVRGQIAHLDRDRENNASKNLSYMCQKHHDDYDSPRSQTKGYTEAEIRLYQEELEGYLAENPLGTWSYPAPRKQKISVPVPSPDLYDRRMVIYRRTRDFLSQVVGNASCSLQDAFSFAADTHEAQFIFDAKFAAYLQKIYEHALHLHMTETLLNQLPVGEERSEAAQEEHENLLWLYDQGAELAKRAHPFLRLS